MKPAKQFVNVCKLQEIFNKPDSRTSNIVSNADMRIAEIRQFCQLQDAGQSLMRAATSQL